MTRGERLAPLLLGALVGALVAGRIETALGCAALATLLAVAAGAPRPGRTWWGVMAGGCGLALVLNLMLVDGAPLIDASVLGRSPSAEGLRMGVLMGLRLFAAGVAMLGLAAAWPGERAADELAGLLRPLERLRVPVARGREVLGLAIRFAPQLGDEVRRIQRLQSHRAGGPPRSVRERLERAQAIVVPAMVGALERAERVALALEARHYRGRVLPDPVVWPAAAAAGWLVAGTALLWRG